MTNDPQEILNEVTEVFHKKLDVKTNWGKEQVKALFKDSLLKVLMKNLSNSPK